MQSYEETAENTEKDVAVAEGKEWEKRKFLRRTNRRSLTSRIRFIKSNLTVTAGATMAAVNKTN